MTPFRLALVTGATSGLGEALADLLYRRGVPLLLTGKDEKSLQKIASRYQAQCLTVDLRGNRTLLIRWIQENQPDLIINNAGFAIYGPILMHPTASQMEILDVNGTAAIEIAIEGARALYANRRTGVILNVSSAAGQLPIPAMSLYAASKAQLTSFSQSFDAEMRPAGIRILAALPGPIATPFAKKASKGRFTQHSSWRVLSADRAAELIWKQIQRKKGVQIIGFWTRLFLFVSHFVPKSLLGSSLQKNLKNRYPLSL